VDEVAEERHAPRDQPAQHLPAGARRACLQALQTV
jgi:hypothetical protein